MSADFAPIFASVSALILRPLTLAGLVLGAGLTVTRLYRRCASAGICFAPPSGSLLILSPRGPPAAPDELPRRLLAP